MQLWHNIAGDKLLIEELQEWVLDALLCLEDWLWLWNPDLDLDLSSSWTPQPLLPPPSTATSVSLPIMSTPISLSMTAPTTVFLPPDTYNGPILSTFVPSVEKEVMWMSIAQPLS